MKFQLYLLVLIFCLCMSSCNSTNEKRTASSDLNDSYVESLNSEEINTAYLQLKKDIPVDIRLTGSFQCNGRPDQKRIKSEVTLVFFVYTRNTTEYMAKYIVRGSNAFDLGNRFDNIFDDELGSLKYFTILPSNTSEIYEFARHYDFRRMKDIEKKYACWARFMPDKRNNVLSSDHIIFTQIYNKKFLPVNAEIVGKYLTIGDEDKETFFIVYSYKEKNKDVPYLEAYKYNNKRIFRKRLFDDDFLQKDQRNKCRFYMKERNFVFENFTISGVDTMIVKQTKIPFFDIYKS